MKRAQSGVFLIEAMVALLIFALGVLGMVALGGIAVASQSDARARTDAGALADEIAGTIALQVARPLNPGTLLRTVDPASLATFEHRPTSAGYCSFSGPDSAVASVTNWAAKAYTTGLGLPGLPGADNTRQQIVVNTATGFNRVEITICWQAPSDTALRRHTLVTYVN